MKEQEYTVDGIFGGLNIQKTQGLQDGHTHVEQERSRMVRKRVSSETLQTT